MEEGRRAADHIQKEKGQIGILNVSNRGVKVILLDLVQIFPKHLWAAYNKPTDAILICDGFW